MLGPEDINAVIRQTMFSQGGMVCASGDSETILKSRAIFVMDGSVGNYMKAGDSCIFSR